MFDNRWENWSGDFAETFEAGRLDPSVRNLVPEILARFGAEVRKTDRSFPDEVSTGTLARVMTEMLPRLKMPENAKAHVPEVVARFLEYLRASGRVGEGDEWAEEVRAYKTPAAVKGVTIRKQEGVAPVGRNDPCPCGSGKKYKKCCLR